MPFIICGLNHKTAPVSIRETIVFHVEKYPELMASLQAWQISEAVLLSTCNRTELFCYAETPKIAQAWLAHQYDIEPSVLSLYSYVYQDEEAMQHALELACGLDSMMLGEPQILGQLKDAYQRACDHHHIKKQLRLIFEYLFSAAKRVRAQSNIGQHAISIAYAGVQLIKQRFADLSSLHILLIGSGETASLVAKYLYEQGASQFYIASRQADHAAKLANQFQGQALSITELASYLPKADIVISATACPLPFIHQTLVRQALKQRAGTPMFFLDLAIPRDIEPEVAQLPAVTLYHVDDLQSIVLAGMEERQKAAVLAQKLVKKELDGYLRWCRAQQADDVICDYRQRMTELAETELKSALNKLSRGDHPAQVLQAYHVRLLNKLTHSPSIGLRQAAYDGREDLFTLVHYLYNTSRISNHYEEIN